MNRTSASPRLLVVGLMMLMVLVLGACGSSAGHLESGGSRRTPATDSGAGQTAAAAVTQQGASQLVRYGGVEFVVPADWPVYDLESDPSICVRFDVHAVYLGHPGADMRCPAGILGRAGAVLVEPLDGASTPTAVASASSVVNDVQLEMDTAATVEHELRAALPAQGLSVTVAFADAEAEAQQILQSLKVATP